MSWSFERSHIRVSINGTPVKTTEEPSITADLGNLCRTAEFVLAGEPDPEPLTSDVVTIELIEGDTVWVLFGGTINSVDVESGGGATDWEYHILAVDQLEKLRATNKSGDLDLTGLTDIEAWKAVADYCGVIYDDADIEGAAFILGQRADVSWKDDASTGGAAIIQELDDVFGCATMTIGDNRVIRIVVDWTPADDTGLYRTYTKTTADDWQGHHRGRGDRDQIQNVWRVTGASVDSADGSCTSTPWAFAVNGNAQIGRRVRTAEQTFSSDFIQDESLAEAIVRRLMRRYNRGPDLANISASVDANLHPGSKAKLVDHTYGIETGSGRRCLVSSVSIAGFGLTADLICGAAGAEGTVTHGVDKVCGDSHTDPDWDDGFTDPSADYPPLDAGDPIDFDDFFERTAGPAPWAMGAPAISCTAPGDPADCDVDTWATGIDVEPADDWEITGTVRLTADTQAYSVGLDTDDGQYRVKFAGGAYYDPLVGQFMYELLTPFGNRRLPGYAPLDVDIAFKLIYHASAHSLELYADVGASLCYSELLPVSDATMIGASTIEAITGGPTRSSETIAHACGEGGGGGGGGLPAADWVDDSGSWVFLGDDEAALSNVAGGDGGRAHWAGAGTPFDDSQRLRLAGTIAFPTHTGTEEDVIISVGFDSLVGDFVGFQAEWAGEGFSAPGVLGPFDSFTAAVSFSDYQDDCCPGTLDIPAGFDFLIDLQPAFDTCDVTLTGASTSATFSIALGVASWPAGGVYPLIEFGQHADSTTDWHITAFTLTIG